MRTEEGRSGTQEIRVWAPQLKQLGDRDRKTLQSILDLVDWRGLHMTSTPGTTLRPMEWATQGRVRGSGFKVVSTSPVCGIPEVLQMQTINRFLANSLMVELRNVQVAVTDLGILPGDQARDHDTGTRNTSSEDDSAGAKTMAVTLPRGCFTGVWAVG